MINPVDHLDHNRQTPPAPALTETCGFCEDGIIIDPTDPDPCQCECHHGLEAVATLVSRGDLSAATGEILIRGIKDGRGFCEGCRQSHTCVICSGTGEV